MEELKQDPDSENLNFGQEGAVVVNISDQAIRLAAWVNQVPAALIGFYYTSDPDSKLKVKLFDLITGNTSPVTHNVMTFEDLTSLPDVIDVKVYPLLSEVKESGINFRKLIYWLETGLDERPQTIVKLKALDEPWRITSFADLRLDEDFDEEKTYPELVLRTIYENRHNLFSQSFDLPLTPGKNNPMLTALKVRDKMITLAEAAYEAAINEDLESELDAILHRDRTTIAAKELLLKINSWLNRGTFFYDEFRRDFDKLFKSKATEENSDRPKIISFSDRDATTLPKIRLELKDLITHLISDNQPPLINFRNLIRIHNEISNLINQETLVIEGNGISWPALVIDSPDSQLVTMTSTLKSHNQLVFSLCRPEVSSISKAEALEVLLYLEGLDDTEQTKYLNIKNALLEHIKTL